MYLDYRRAKINKKYWELQDKRKNSIKNTEKNNLSYHTYKNKKTEEKLYSNGFLKLFNPEA